LLFYAAASIVIFIALVVVTLLYFKIRAGEDNGHADNKE
jgi:hypothetical protein